MTTILRMLALFASLLALPRLFLALDEDGKDGKDDDSKDGDDSDGGSDDSDDDSDSDGDTDGGEDDGDDDEPPKKFTQADLDSAIDKRLARERRKHERELEKAKGGKGKDGKDSKPDPNEERVTRAQGRVVKTEAKAAALAAGVDPKRVARFLRLVELDDPGEFLSDDDEPDEEAIAAAVEEALEDVPEFKAKSDDGDGKRGKGKSGGDGMNGDGERKRWTRAEIDKMSPEEIDKNWDSIQEAMKAGAIK